MSQEDQILSLVESWVLAFVQEGPHTTISLVDYFARAVDERDEFLAGDFPVGYQVTTRGIEETLRSLEGKGLVYRETNGANDHLEYPEKALGLKPVWWHPTPKGIQIAQDAKRRDPQWVEEQRKLKERESG